MFSYKIVISSPRGYYCLGEGNMYVVNVREMLVLFWCFPPVMTEPLPLGILYPILTYFNILI
jgi:hypothetical protein